MMPIFIDGDLLIDMIDGTNIHSIPYTFSNWHIVQYLFIVFGLFFTIIVSIHNTSKHVYIYSLKIFFLSGLIVSLLGLGEIIFFELQISYPFYFLNNSISGSINSPRLLNEYNVVRISSVAEEPSFFAQHILAIFPIGIFSVLCGRPILSPMMDKFAVAIMGVSLFLSKSTTGYLGLIIVILVTSALIVLKRRPRLKSNFVLLILFLLVVVFIWFTTESVSKYIVETFITNKLNTGSAILRIHSINKAIEYFLSYPIFGIGWGVTPIYSFFFKMLAGMGILGTFFFLLIIYYPLYNLIRYFNLKVPGNLISMECWAGAFLVSTFSQVLVLEMSGFESKHLIFWFLLGMTISSTALYRKDLISSLPKNHISNLDN